MIEKFEDTPFEKNHQSTVADDFYYRVYEDKWVHVMVIYYLYLKKIA